MHVRSHLARLCDGQVAVDDPSTVFPGAGDGEFFQELVGLRMAGISGVLLAVLHFQSHGLPGIPWARESLAS